MQTLTEQLIFNLESSWFLIIGSWFRLPLQIPLIQWALRTPVK